MEFELIIRQGLRPREDAPVDIGIADGQIRAVERHLDAPTNMELDAHQNLVTPAFVDAHFHLDTVLTSGFPRYNASGTLTEGILLWRELQQHLTEEGIKERAWKYLRWCVAQGTLHMRSHVDICHHGLVAVRTLLELRNEARDLIDLQLVAFPQHGFLRFPAAVRLLDEALDLGVDVVGGIPHYELTRDDGVKSIRALMNRAQNRELQVDIHCDETDDSTSRFAENLAEETIRRGMEGLVTGSHLTAMHSYDNAYAQKLITILHDAGLHVVSNPLTNMTLQGRMDGYPKRRGLTRIKELLAAGVNVAFGHDCALDPWYPLGTADMLQVAFMAIHAGHMTGMDEIEESFDAVTVRGAEALGISRYGLEVGCEANLVVLEAKSVRDALRLSPARLAVVRRGQVVARSSPRLSMVEWQHGHDEVDFSQPDFY